MRGIDLSQSDQRDWDGKPVVEYPLYVGNLSIRSEASNIDGLLGSNPDARRNESSLLALTLLILTFKEK
jgi:hypothetical protein